MPEEQPVPPDYLMMQAWIAYTKTENYQNTARWAATHTAGSLWAAFVQGWHANERAAAEAEVV